MPDRREPPTSQLTVGEVVGPLEVGPIAHGGHWVARHEGQVIFVRHALTGERVRVRITSVTKRYARGDAVEVVEPSEHRVTAPCPIAGRCGGCDLQHVDPAHQPELKRRVVSEQLRRLAGIVWEGEVEPVPPLLGWRTRVRFHAAGDAWGMHPPRSTAVVELPPQGCLIAAPGLSRPPAPPSGPGDESILGVRSADGVRWTARGDGALDEADPVGRTEPTDPGLRLGASPRVVTERAAGRDFAVALDGFWQIHPAAAQTLVGAVLAGLEPQRGESAWDLYCGVGLFAGALDAAGVRVSGVEGNRAAVDLARGNVPNARFWAGDVARRLGSMPPRPDLVVLDPPRVGAGAAVVRGIVAAGPRAVAYVACDPSALARDLATFTEAGWLLRSLRAFDLFGMTHHVECVAILEPGDGPS